MEIKPLADTNSGGAGLAILNQLETKTQIPIQWRGRNRGDEALIRSGWGGSLVRLLIASSHGGHSNHCQNGNIPDLNPYAPANMTLESKHVAIKVR